MKNYPYKMKLEIDYYAMKQQGYNISSIRDFIGSEMKRLKLVKDNDGIYVGKSFEAFWAMILFLSNEDWVKDNVIEWKWYNGDYYEEDDKYSVEDLKEFYFGDHKESYVG